MKKTVKSLCLLIVGIFITNSSNSQIISSNQYENVVNTGSKTIYNNGVSKTYYVENGVSVTTSGNLLDQYGKYFQIHIEIENLTGSEFTFDPNSIVALLTKYKIDKKTKVVSVESQKKGVILSAEEYIKKVQNRQQWQSAISAFVGAYDAQQAGYSYSATTTAVAGHSNTYGSVNNYYTNESVNYIGKSYGTAVGTSVTESYNGQAAYNAQKEAQKEAQQYDDELYQIRTELNQGYLKINTIGHRERLKGSVNLVFEDVDNVELLIPVNGKYYSFLFNNNQQSNKKVNIQNNSNIEASSNLEVNEMYAKAKSCFNNKKYDEAVIVLTEALKIEPQNLILLVYRGALYYNFLNQKENGIADVTSAINYDTLNTYKYNNLSFRCGLYFTEAKYDLILKDADDMIKLDPKKTKGYEHRAMANMGLKNYYPAIIDYQKVIDICKKQLNSNDNLGIVYNNMGYCYVVLEDYEKALPLINSALELNPNFSFIWGSRGVLYYKKGEYKKCIADMTTSINLVENGNNKGTSSDPSVPYYYRALSNIKRGKTNEICLDLTKAIELGNKDAENVFNEYCKKQ